MEKKTTKGNLIIGTKIEALLAENEMKQVDLASKLGVSEPAVSAWIRGERNPGRNNAIALGKLFGKPKEYFEMSGIEDDNNKTTTEPATQYDIISKKIAAGYFDVIKQLAKLRDEGKISEETFNKSMDKLDS